VPGTAEECTVYVYMVIEWYHKQAHCAMH